MHVGRTSNLPLSQIVRRMADNRHMMQDMFGRIAARYDLMNRLMTFGQDRRWRRFVVQQARLRPGGWLLDIATGTGDIALEARQPGARSARGGGGSHPADDARGPAAQRRGCDRVAGGGYAVPALCRCRVRRRDQRLPVPQCAGYSRRAARTDACTQAGRLARHAGHNPTSAQSACARRSSSICVS